MATLNRYKYRARNKEGDIITGLVEAASMEAAEKTLSEHGMAVLSVETPKTFAEIFNLRGKVKMKDRANFTRQMATMVNAGLPLPQVLNLLSRSETSEVLKNAIIDIQEDLETGYSFSTALSKHPKIFSRVFINAVRAGEATGKLEVVLLQLADTLERDSQAGNKLKTMMLYPAFIVMAMVVVGGIMMVRVVPVLVSVFDEAEESLPLATKILIAISSFLINFWWLVLILFIAAIFGLRVYIQTERGKALFDQAKLRIYILRDLSKMFYMARFSRTLGMLVSAGVPLLESVQITSDAMDNVVYKHTLERVSIQLERGVAMSLALSKSDIFPPLISQMVLVGEQTGELDKVLVKMSKTYEEEYDTLIKGAATLIEPVVIILLGAGVAFMVFAILIPIYQISLIQ